MKHSRSPWRAWLFAALGITIATAGVVTVDIYRSIWCMVIIGVGLFIAIVGGARFNRPPQ